MDASPAHRTGKRKEAPVAARSVDDVGKRTRVEEADALEVPSDDEGRLDGSGLNAEQQQILDILGHDPADAVPDHPRDQVAHARKLFVALERAMNANQAMRLKHADEPRAFLPSEADLDAAIRDVAFLATDARLLYPEFVRHDMAATMATLLTHDNPDIAAAAIDVIAELVDDDDGDALRDALHAHDVPRILLSNLQRLNDAPDSDRYEDDARVVYAILSALESFGRYDTYADPLVAWLVSRIVRGRMDQNQAYAAELLAASVAENEAVREALARHDGMDALLRALSRYLHTSPRDTDEHEFFRNVVDTLQYMLLDAAQRDVFLACEGVELMLRLLKQGRRVRRGALAVLLAAAQYAAGAATCVRIVEAGGLRALGALLDRPDDVLLHLLHAMLYNLASDSTPRLRLLSKFLDPRKVEAVVEARETGASVDGRVSANAVLAWLAMEDDTLQALVTTRVPAAELAEALEGAEFDPRCVAASGDTLEAITHALTAYLRSL